MKNKRRILALAAAGLAAATMSANAQTATHAKIQTSMGDIVIALNTDKAPASVENFLTYAASGHYDRTIFHRVVTGYVIQGGGSISWRGLDLEARYAYEPFGAGPIDWIWFSVMHTYTDQVLVNEFGADAVDETGLVGYPRHRSLASAGLSSGPLSMSLLANRRGRVETVRSDIAEAKIPAITTFDLSARAAFRDNVSATVTVKNITGRQPPIALSAETGGTFPQYYDIVGRRFSVNLKAAF